MGVDKTIKPNVAGTFSISIIAMPRDTVRRIPSTSPSAACRETAGSTAVPIDTPNRPIGKYISRNA